MVMAMEGTGKEKDPTDNAPIVRLLPSPVYSNRAHTHAPAQAETSILSSFSL